MKKLLMITIVASFLFMQLIFITNVVAYEEDYETQDGCYICYMHDHYVIFVGEDTPQKRQRARKEFGCKVYAVLNYCHPRNFKTMTKIDFLIGE